MTKPRDSKQTHKIVGAPNQFNVTRAEFIGAVVLLGSGERDVLHCIERLRQIVDRSAQEETVAKYKREPRDPEQTRRIARRAICHCMDDHRAMILNKQRGHIRRRLAVAHEELSRMTVMLGEEGCYYSEPYCSTCLRELADQLDAIAEEDTA